MEKAIEIKRRAQRCVQNGDLDGALTEYEKLIASDDTDPYNFVLLADLLYKKGESGGAAQRYLAAATAYEKAGLYKNGIAVCKKMMRLSLSQSPVLLRLAVLHELDGIATESALYYLQYAENLVREDRLEDAATHFRKAFDTCPENIRALERLAEVNVLTGHKAEAANVLLEVSGHYQRAGQLQDADRCRNRAAQLSPVAGLAGENVPNAPMGDGAKAGGAFEIESTSVWSRGPDSAPAEPAKAGPVAAPMPTNEVAGLSPGASGPPRLDIDAVMPGAPAMEAALEERRAEQAISGPPRLTDAPEIETSDDEIEILSSTETEEDEAEPFDLDEAAAPVAAAAAEAPGLRFDSPAPPEPVTAVDAEPTGLQRVEKLLAAAQAHFRAGEREAAGVALSEAAREYDEIGQHDSAATIYRSLGKSATAGVDVMMQWLANCERRSDHVEAAQVACDLGDRALNDGDADGARSWFDRARMMDPSNALATRRLQRLDAPAGSPPPPEPAPVHAAAPAAPAAPSTNGSEMGRVEVAVGRGEAVTFDLSSLVSEFQRGVEMQLSGDSQGHYDLGMAYREMGLLEQSVEAFRTAGRDPSFSHRSAEMIGRCMLDQGRFDEAAQEFGEALAMPQVTPEQGADLRYQLGLAHEAAGRSAEALSEFERVYAVQSNYPDVALKIRVLRKALETR